MSMFPKRTAALAARLLVLLGTQFLTAGAGDVQNGTDLDGAGLIRRATAPAAEEYAGWDDTLWVRDDR